MDTCRCRSIIHFLPPLARFKGMIFRLGQSDTYRGAKNALRASHEEIRADLIISFPPILERAKKLLFPLINTKCVRSCLSRAFCVAQRVLALLSIRAKRRSLALDEQKDRALQSITREQQKSKQYWFIRTTTTKLNFGNFQIASASISLVVVFCYYCCYCQKES